MAARQAVERAGRDRDDVAQPLSCVRAHMRPPVCIVPSSLKKKITIEDLLNWTYREQRILDAGPEGFDPTPVHDYAPAPREFLADRVDASGKFVMTAHHDAYRVHEAVLALGREPMVSPAWEPPAHEVRMTGDDTGFGSCGQFPTRPELKTHSRAALVMVSALHLPPDPCLSPEIEVTRGKTIYQMRRGLPVRDAQGRQIGIACVVSFSGDLPWIVAHERWLFGQWRSALADLRDSLSARDSLRAHRIVNHYSL